MLNRVDNIRPASQSRFMTSVQPDHAKSPVSSMECRTASGDDGVHDFDFLHGSWRVHNRRLRSPLRSSAEWYEFEGTSVVCPLWDGRGNFEQWEANGPDGHIRAISLHLYDARSQCWSLHWAPNDSSRIGIPTIGSFANGRGEFYSQELFEMHPIFLRLTWEDCGFTMCRFEQAFSADGGHSWETNWTMDFTREP